MVFLKENEDKYKVPKIRFKRDEKGRYVIEEGWNYIRSFTGIPISGIPTKTTTFKKMENAIMYILESKLSNKEKLDIVHCIVKSEL